MKSHTMSIIRTTALTLGLSLPLMAWAQGPIPRACSVSPKQLAENKKVALEFFRKDITLKELIDLIDLQYVQHNPIAVKAEEEKQISAYEAFKQLFTRMAALGGAGQPDGPARPGNPGFLPVIAMAECDLVTVIVMNKLPDPTVAGTNYEAFHFDTFRVRNGKLTEHWDGAVISKEAMEGVRKMLSAQNGSSKRGAPDRER